MNAAVVAEQLPTRTETVDHYLEVIFCITGEGEPVRPSRLADWLEVSAPTVTAALQRMARDGWVEIARDRSVTLTQAGERAATDIVRRHRLLERWLTDVLGFDWASADIEADRLSRAVSDEVLARLDETMKFPSTCPHGNVIPGRETPYGTLIALADLATGETARVQRISEIAEHEARPLLRMLDENGIRTGSIVSIMPGRNPHEIEVSQGGSKLTLSSEVARLIWVETT